MYRVEWLPQWLFGLQILIIHSLRASLVTQTVKNLPTMQETHVRSLGQEDLLEEGILTSVFLPGEFHGQRSLVGYNSWNLKESGKTEQLMANIFTFPLEKKLANPAYKGKHEGFETQVQILMQPRGVGHLDPLSFIFLFENWS